TTANALSFLLHLLPQHPAVERKLCDEIEEVLKGREPEPQDFYRLKYTEMVFLETLRLYPPVWLKARQSVQDDTIAGYRIPAGTILLLSPWTTHRDSRFWPDPLRFDPERFADESIQRASRFDYFPFAGGPRVCVGQRFAIMEAQTVITRVLQKFELKALSK